jgi:hypothetical protein
MKFKKSKKSASPPSGFQSPFWSMFKYKFIQGLSLFVLAYYLYIFVILFQSEQRLIPFTMIALITGMIYQSYQITKNLERILIYSVITAFGSLMAFGQSKSGMVYQFENHVRFWIYAFIFIYLFIMWVEHHKQIRACLDEGSSLLLSMGFIYWIYSKDLFHFTNLGVITLNVLALSFSFYTLVHAFFNIKHRALSRFILSFGSCLIIILLTFDNLFNLTKMGDLNLAKTWQTNLLLILQYFLLGVSSLYLFQNFMLILQYLPSKYSGSIITNFKSTTLQHIERYSELQLSKFEAFVYFSVSAISYSLNAYFKYIPPNMNIWLIIFCLPILFHYYVSKKLVTLTQAQPVIKKSQFTRSKNRNKRKRKK